MHFKKVIVCTIIEIVVLIITLFITYNIWDNFELEEDAKIAYSYTNKKALKLNLENHLKPLIPIDDDEYKKENNHIKINLSNDDTKIKKYELYLKIDDSSTLNTDYLKLSYKNIIYSLKDLKQNKSNYYLIDTSNINSSIETSDNLYIWLDINTPNNQQGKTINMEIFIEEV